MLSDNYNNLLKSFADAQAGNQPAPQQDPNQVQQIQNAQGQQPQQPPQQGSPQGQPQPDPNQQPQQDPNQLQQAQQQQAQQDAMAQQMMEKVAAGTVYLVARNMAIKKGFQPGTPEYYRYIGESIEVGSGC